MKLSLKSPVRGEDYYYYYCNVEKFWIFRPKTTIAEIFAIMRQWVPQVQQNIEMLIREVSVSYFSK